MKSIEKIKNKTRRMAVHRLVRAFLGCGGNQPWKWVEAALLVAGLTLAGLYFAGRLESYVESRAALKEFQSRDAQAFPRPLPPIENRAPTNGEASGADPDKSIRKPSPQRRAPLGVLEIPSIRLRVPLIDGADPASLNRGVGRITGTARPGENGNIGIAGHRDSFFKGLKNVKPGDKVLLKTATGDDTYVVSRFQIVSPQDVSVLRTKDSPALSLVTCYPFSFIGSAPERFVVTAYLSNHQADGPAAASDAELMTQPNTTTLEEQ